jgi:pyruvate dehydrogenase E2 component (dihydrolipoamide acetyltransferase)
MTDIQMPSLSDAMEEGTILTWLKADGDHIDRGEELVEIETDKATMTYESPAEGVLEIIAEAGSTVPVGAVIARMGVAGSESSSATAGNRGEEVRKDAGSSAATEEIPPSAIVTVAAPSSTNGDASIRATPLARRLAEAHGVDLSGLSGSGPRGRVRRADVQRAAGIEPAPTTTPGGVEPQAPTRTEANRAGPGAPADGAGAKGAVETIQLTRLQQVIARRMSEAKATVPEFQVETEVGFDAALAMRTQFKQQAGDRTPSFNDLIIKACALALRDHPRVNGSYRDGVFELHGRINIGMAVAADDALVVPTVFDADTRSLGSIAFETKRLAERVRDGNITPPELAGGTFTVSNLGMYGMSAITPVINPPQAAILGVGSVRALPAVVHGELTERHVLTLRLSCDHRILYGADAARFLATVRGYLEQPLNLAL